MIIKPKVNIILLIAVTITGMCLFAYPETITAGAKQGIKICLSTLIPSLFPFMVLGTFIMRTGTFNFLSTIFGRLTKRLFMLPENSWQIIFMSLIGGYPIGAKLTSDALYSGEINEDEAKRLCIFCMNAGPAFAVSTLGVGIYNNIKIGIIIYISLCVSSLILGFLTRFLCENRGINSTAKYEVRFSGDDISFSVWNSFEAILKICAWVILFSGFTDLIEEKFDTAGKILGAIMEVTGGTITISEICPIPVVTALCGFGGFCVHCQVLKYLSNCTLSYKVFFVGRTLNAAISSAICYIILYYYPIETNVAYTFSTAHISSVSISLPTIITFIFMCISMIFNIDRRKKIC